MGGQAEETSKGGVPWEEEKEEIPSEISYNIISYEADYPVDGIVRRFRQEDILFLIFSVNRFGSGPGHRDLSRLFCQACRFRASSSTKKKIQKECKSLMKVCKFHVHWRAPIGSWNCLISSTMWRQDHNGFTHQDPRHN